MPATSDTHPYDRHVGRYGRTLAADLIKVAGVSPGEQLAAAGRERTQALRDARHHRRAAFPEA